MCPKANDEGYKAEVAKERVEIVCIVRVVGFRSHESRYLPLLDRSMHLRQLCHCRDLYADAPSKLVQTIQINTLVEDDDEDMLHFSEGW